MFGSPGQSQGIYLPYHSPLFVIRCTEEAFDSSLVRLQTDLRVFSYSWSRQAPVWHTQCPSLSRLLPPPGGQGRFGGSCASPSPGMSRYLLRSGALPTTLHCGSLGQQVAQPRNSAEPVTSETWLGALHSRNSGSNS